MSWCTPADVLSPNAKQVLTDMASNGSSEAAAVADCLNTIASNGEEQATDRYLVGCAEEIRDYAIRFINLMRPLVNCASCGKAIYQDEAIYAATWDDPNTSKPYCGKCDEDE